MPIGASKVGVMGAGLVPGGTTTFNASGTFTVPPGVRKVNITGKGGTGNPGNAGNAGNPGNFGTGGGGGGGGGRANNVSGFSPAGCGGYGGASFNAQPFFYSACVSPSRGTPGNANPSCSPPYTGNGGNAGGAGTAGNAGSAGNPGNAGTAGNSSTGLCKTFPGGAGGNAGNAGAAGTAGAAGVGGAGGLSGGGFSPSKPANGTVGAPGSGGGGSGGAGYCTLNQGKPPQNSNPSSIGIAGGAGGGGAGITNPGSTGSAGAITPNSSINCPTVLRALTFGGNSPMSAPAPNVAFQNNTPSGVIPSNMTGGTSDWWGNRGGANAVSVIPNASLDPGTNRGTLPAFSGPCVPSVVRSGAGGGGGSTVSLSLALCSYLNTNGFTSGGAAGGGRGGAAGAGGASTAGSGSAATPQTFNCVPVTPGAPYPIVVGGPSGGQVVISWNPQ